MKSSSKHVELSGIKALQDLSPRLYFLNFLLMKKLFKISSLIILIAFTFLIQSCKKDKPQVPTVETATTSLITQTSGSSGGKIISDGGSTVLSRGICWSTNNTPVVSDNKTQDGAGAGSFTSNMSGLLPNTIYFVRAYATSASGIGYGMAMSFTTLKATIPVLTTVTATSITQSTASCGGTITSDGAAQITARGICWSTLEYPTILDNKTTDGGGIGSFTSSITGLTGNTVYYVRAYATNSAGTEYGNQITFKSGPAAPTLTTTTLSSIFQVSVVSGGNIINDGGSPILIRGICYSTTQNPTTTDNKTADGSGSGIFTSSISNLIGNTTYYIKAYAINDIGTGYGNVLTITTQNDLIQFNPLLTYGTLTDIDGNSYKTIIIGTQTWMAENLRTTKYSNGDFIGTTSPATKDISAESTPKYQWPNAGNESTTAIYGRLYTWYALADDRKICPTGWHIPSDTEWTTLITYLSDAGGKLKEISINHWFSPNTGATNETGFTALPGGVRMVNGLFFMMGTTAEFWSSTSVSLTNAGGTGLENFLSGVGRGNGNKNNGNSIRCIKN